MHIMMKGVHLFPSHRFATWAIPFFKNKFPDYNFDCIVLSRSTDDEEFRNIEGSDCYIVKGITDCLGVLKTIFDKYDFVFFHSLFLRSVEKTLFVILHHNLVKKIVWIEWGYDLYLNKESGIKGYLNDLKNKLVRSTFEKKIPFFVGIHPVDLKAYENEIGGRAQLLYAPYSFRETVDSFLMEYKPTPLSEKLKRGDPFTIQIGHRALRELNHISLLERLSVYKEKNIKIVIPLSYGDREYAKEVENYALSIFNDKVQVLDDFMQVGEYRLLLSGVDMLVIDSMRQIALGNIHSMFYMCKKVYLHRDSLLSKFFIENGINIYDINDIGRVPFEILTAEDDLSSERNFIVNFNSKKPAEIWRETFDQILN